MAPQPSLKSYPAGALLRAGDICSDRKAGRPGLLPINKRTWFRWAEAGKVSPGKKLGSNTRVWPVEEVLALVGEVA